MVERDALDELVARLRSDQRERWLRGGRILIESYIEQHPELIQNEELFLDLIYGEYCLREQLDDPVQPEEYFQRFPEVAELLKRLFEVHQAVAAGSTPVIRARRGTRPVPAADFALPELPQRIGRYRVDELLGRGGFGLVYLAHDEQLSRRVAVKVPHADRLARAEDAGLYLTEARTVANLDHLNIVPVYDVGTTDDFPFFIVSKYIEGADLATILNGSKLSYSQAAELVATVAQALHHAHTQGLVHRDIKPGNILLNKSGQPFVVDFGLALREQDVGKGGGYAGTPAYMSPEQARGEGHRVDGRSDIFSLGVVFYELLVGRRPFRGDSTREVFDQIIHHEPRPLRQCDDTVPKELERICLKMLSKKATERYLTAKDVAEDLQHFLKQNMGDGVSSLGAGLLKRTARQETFAPADTPAGTPILGSQSLKIVPKGLRSFDEHDADFFLELLPGPRDRDGLPDSIRFWKTRIQETDADKTFSVGLIYGPSGCGKSSMVKAGLLPRLSGNVISVYVEATSDETESRLLHGLRKHCPTLAGDLSLKDTLAALRHGQGVPVGQKVLIILDQFEQWLYAKKEKENSELVQALRQCDGEHVQCIVMVRDDFWMAVTRFLRDLEVELVQGRNLASVDLFDLRHARQVLTAIAQAFGAFPETLSETTAAQRQFLDQAVSDLAEDGKVVCVRLALFAEMMKTKPWTPTTLKAVGGTKGIGVTFLEETFCSSAANPHHRLHQTAVRAVLRAMLPESGSDIKGNMRSYGELLGASGYGDRPKEFDDLIRILDSENRLITPTDPEGAEAEMQGVWFATGQKYFQLTHDYLVPSLREWLNRKQRETRRGRSELRLAERSAGWNAKPENRQLPALWEYLNIRLLTQGKSWTEPQRKLMSKAGRVHATRCALGTLLAIGVLFATREAAGRFQAASLVNQLTSADIAQVPGIIEKLNAHRSWVNPLLRREHETAGRGSNQKLHSALALLPVKADHVADLQEQLVIVTPNQFPVVRDALLPYKEAVVEPLWGVALDKQLPTERRFQAACALATYAPQDKRWIEIDSLVATHFVSRQASEFLAWREALRPAAQQLFKPLGILYRDAAQERQYRILSTEALAEYFADRPDDLFELMADAEWFQFSLIFGKVVSHNERGFALAQAELEKHAGEDATEGERETLAKRQANAAVALYRLGRPDRVWPHLKHSPDPRVRSHVIHFLARSGADPQAIVDRLDSEPDVTVRRALVLALGEFNNTRLPAAQKRALIEKLLVVYEKEPDAGLHGAAEWLLRKWGHEERIAAADKKILADEQQSPVSKDAQRRWYINAQGQTFVIVDAGEFWMGSPESEPQRGTDEDLHRRPIRWRFALSTKEITKSQFLRFQPTFSHLDFHRYPEPDCPIGGVTWYEAAAYCNWLNEQEGISNDQLCYEPNEQGKFAEGMTTKKNYLELSGYRLPTEAEWECACRAGTSTSRYYGLTETLLSNYAWCSLNSKDTAFPVGRLKPNDYGLFDMQGHVFEWCQGTYQTYAAATTLGGLIAHDADVKPVQDAVSRMLRGGAFYTHPTSVRSAERTGLLSPGTRNFLNGFRPARTVP